MLLNKWTIFFAISQFRFAKFASVDLDPNVAVKFYDEKHDLHVIDLTVPENYDTEYLLPRLYSDIDVRFWLYTKYNINYFEELYIDLKKVVFYDPRKPLVILTHGWKGSGYGNSTQLVKDAYLSVCDVNVIIVDWQQAASDDWYITSAYLTHDVGEKIRDMILALSKTFKIDGRHMHFIGHSLGAHVVGWAGLSLRQKNFIIERVTGLDPARPFFEYPEFIKGITKDAARFVDIIHTNSGVLGYQSSIGHIDFYPNGGTIQPHCCPNQNFTVSCEHMCSYIYFEEAVLGRKYISTKCESYENYVAGFCYLNDKQLLGLPKKNARGDYYVTIM